MHKFFTLLLVALAEVFPHTKVLYSITQHFSMASVPGQHIDLQVPTSPCPTSLLKQLAGLCLCACPELSPQE